MINKILQFALISLVIPCMIPAAFVSAAEIIDSGKCGEDLTWTLDSDGVIVISGNGAMTDFAASKDAPWFKYKDSIKAVRAEKGVTTIGDRAFLNYIGIKSIELPETIFSIGVTAFRYTGLGDLKLPEGLVYIKESAFYWCSDIINLELPSTLKRVGKSAFEACSSLKYITVNSKDAIFGQKVFFDSDNGLTIYGYGGSTAEACSRGEYGSTFIPFDAPPVREVLGQGECGVDAVWVLYTDGELVISGSGGMENWKKGQSPWSLYFAKYVRLITIAEGITSIGSYAFDAFQELESISISNTVKRIEPYAFMNSIKLKEIEIPESVEYIGCFAFFECRYLANVTIKNPNAVLDEAIFFDAENVTLYGYKGSTAESYPNAKFKLITEEVTAAVTDPITDTHTPATVEPLRGNETNNTAIASVTASVIILIFAFSIIALIKRRK